MLGNMLKKWCVILVGSAALLLPMHASATSAVQIQTKTETFWFKKLSNKNPAYMLYVEKYDPYYVDFHIVPDKVKKRR